MHTTTEPRRIRTARPRCTVTGCTRLADTLHLDTPHGYELACTAHDCGCYTVELIRLAVDPSAWLRHLEGRDYRHQLVMFLETPEGQYVVSPGATFPKRPAKSTFYCRRTDRGVSVEEWQ